MAKALFFDVFGTMVDWYRGVAREAERVLAPRGVKLDWLEFSKAWRAQYQPGMEEVRSGQMPFARLDVIHRRMLARIQERFGLEKLDEATAAELNLAWHRLDAWPDVAPDLARRNDLRWDAILGAEIARDYKPKPRVYLAAAEAFALDPGECMMVAAHSNDLSAAAACGLKTAHVARPDEYGPGTGERGPLIAVDVAAASFEDLAAKLGA